MREIKFRAWYKGDIKLGKPLLFEQVEVDDELYFVHKKDDALQYRFYIPFIDNDWILEQYTGLKDKNGKEICEGDIVEIEVAYKTFLVRYEQTMCAFSLIMLPEYHFNEPLLLTQEKTQYIKIIGNIHKNPELLKGATK